MASTTLILFTDRVFLGHHSVEALAAATPSGLTAFMFTSLFLGVVTYTNTFVAQFTGAGRTAEVGAAIWQAVYMALLGGVVLALLSAVGGPLFSLFGHEEEVQRQEVQYFVILMVGAVFMLLKDGLACFYSGRGFTRPIMLVNLAGALVNIPLDYVLIHGAGPIPAYGIVGAGVASITGQALMAVLFAMLVFRSRWESTFRVRQWQFDRALFMKLLRYGGPAGLQFFMDLISFTFFIGAVGRLGRIDLAASNVAFALNSLSFLPMIGVSIAANTLVGQALGAGDPDGARRATTSTLHIAMLWMGMVALVYLLFPDPLIRLFRPPDVSAELYDEIVRRGTWLLRFVAFYSLFDAMNLVHTGALKGGGDTVFIGWTSLLCGIFCLMLPVYLGIEYLDAGIYISWGWAALYICILALIFRRRFHRGNWHLSRIVEPALPESRERI